MSEPLPTLGEPFADARLSPDGLYRYSLLRRWGRGLNCVFVMLNPSTADATVTDPTVRRCLGFARQWRADGLIVINLYGLRATDPSLLRTVADPVGPDNDHHVGLALQTAAVEGGIVVAAWGVNGAPDRVRRVVSLAPSGMVWQCLGTTKAGHPRHPLYVRGDTQPTPWTVPDA